ncbi:MAG: FHA domain-containing protein, partial [Phycisphaerales bacterium]|nr:FHA domain-containing protein [Phycisphaerales bacterium]
MPRLLVIRGADEGKQFDLTDAAVSIGRDASARIRLHDTEVSRKHAEFRAGSGCYQVVDVGSANGTFVNNQKIKESNLQAGDQIAMGQTILLYSSGHGSLVDTESDLAAKISMISRGDIELSSAIVKTVGELEGSRIFEEPDAASPWLKSALANLTVLYEASQAISHILDISELLNRILELVFRSIAADRGCIMLSQRGSADLEPRALRLRTQSDEQEKFALSRTIMDYVLREKKGILVTDAGKDERFSQGQSITKYGIREVICVPMKGRHETIGVLYLDTYTGARELASKQTISGKFNEDHLHLAIAVAHQAAL